MKTIESLSLEYPPPHNLDVETCLIATCIISRPDRETILNYVTETDFYGTRNAIVFSALRKIVERKENPDLTTIVIELQKTGDIERAGGAMQVAQILDSESAPNPKQYIKHLLSLSALRRLLEFSNAIAKRCYNREDSGKILTAAQDLLNDIADSGIGMEFKASDDSMLECFERLEKLKGGKSQGLETGFFDIDNILQGLKGGNLIVLAGRPSMGKTALMCNLSINFGARGYKQAVFSLEMSGALYSERLIVAKSGVDYQKIMQGNLNSENWKAMHEAGNSIAGYPISTSDKSSPHYTEIQNMCRRLKRKSGLDVVMIDYLGFIKGTPTSKKQRYQEIGEITKALKDMAKELDVPVILLCQLNRELENRKDKRPALHDMKESGEIEQDADVVMSIYRDAFYDKSPDNKLKNIAEIVVLKNRHGPTGSVKLRFEAKTMKFRNLDTREFEA